MVLCVSGSALCWLLSALRTFVSHSEQIALAEWLSTATCAKFGAVDSTTRQLSFNKLLRD